MASGSTSRVTPWLGVYFGIKCRRTTRKAQDTVGIIDACERLLTWLLMDEPKFLVLVDPSDAITAAQ